MDERLKGLVLKTVEYKESDLILNILTLEKGKVAIRAKGVRKNSSKLKPYCQSFCFAEFEVVQNKGFEILTGANLIDSFYNLVEIEKFPYAISVLEVLDRVCQENEKYDGLFLDTVKCLNVLAYENVLPKLALSKFFYDTLSLEGFELNFKNCSNCDEKLQKNVFFEAKSGEFLCEKCKTDSCVKVSPATLSGLKMIKENNYDKLSTIKLNDKIVSNILSLLVLNLTNRYEIRFKSLTF